MSSEKGKGEIERNSFTHICNNVGSRPVNAAVTEIYYPGFVAPQAVMVSCVNIIVTNGEIAGICRNTGKRCYLLDPVSSVS